MLSTIPPDPAATPPSTDRSAGGRLTNADAVDIWIARWLRIRRVDLVRRYGCDPRRLYEIWEERRFAGSRETALAIFARRYPTLVGRVDYGRHCPISKAADPNQLSFFEPPR